jgi:holo-[acyl-carrier protein] synthase
MIKDIGVDITDIRRFEKIEHDKDFLSEILTEREIVATPDGEGRAPALAQTFAAKEAILKALGCGLHFGSYWKDIDIDNECAVNFHGFTASLIMKECHSKIHISRSSSKNYTIAFVLIE